MSTELDINYALVEETRPAIYTAMKYWGKKPHNIWRQYIEHYTPPGGTYLDPFAGSATSAFEAVKAGRKVIAFDINPMTSFFIEVYNSEYNRTIFERTVMEIVTKIESDPVYIANFTTTCIECQNEAARIVNFKWKSNEIYELAIQCAKHPGANGFRFTRPPTVQEQVLASGFDSSLLDNYWIPPDEFHNSDSFSGRFIRDIGGKAFRNLWTMRNLYILARIFDLISRVDDSQLRIQLAFSFVQTLHLTSKMSVPRNTDANRAFSTSWGRSAYLVARRQMEMNPLHVFISSSLGKQSTDSVLSSIKDYLGVDHVKASYVDQSNRASKTTNFDIKYGIVNVLNITDYIEPKSVDFIMTDPPYGELVKYLDLSTIWLVWLKKLYPKLVADYSNEIIVSRDHSLQQYENRLTTALKNLNTVLKDDGKIVFTFHNQKLSIWNAFLRSVQAAGFKVEKVIHQQNRRTGESNVANPYGTSGTDFYIRCIKSTHVELHDDESELVRYIQNTAIRLIAARNEPTPYQILFNGILAEVSGAGFSVDNFDKTIHDILEPDVDRIFRVTDNEANLAGDFWWFVRPADYISHPDKPLAARVEESIVALLRRRQVISLDDALAAVFVEYPNGLTPTSQSIKNYLEKYATRSRGRWIYQGDRFEQAFTEHTRIIKLMSDIGKKLGFSIYIGKREQAEKYGTDILSSYAEYQSLAYVIREYDQDALKRIEMIDQLWLDPDANIRVAIEVENSTNFISAVQRASNLVGDIPKFMIIPDYREYEILSIPDPLFISAFNAHGWKYLKYSDVERLASMRVVTYSDVLTYCRSLASD